MEWCMDYENSMNNKTCKIRGENAGFQDNFAIDIAYKTIIILISSFNHIPTKSFRPRDRKQQRKKKTRTDRMKNYDEFMPWNMGV